MTQFKLSLLVQAIDKVTAPARGMGRALSNLSRKAGLDKLAKSGRQVGVALAGAGREFLRFGKWAVAGAGAAGAAIFGLIKRTANLGDSLAKTADRLGVGIVALQRLRHAAELGGMANGQFDESLRFMLNTVAEAAQGLGEAKDTIGKLGVSLTDSNGRLKDGETLMLEFADAIAKIEDPTLKVSVAQDIFGRSGARMLNLLNQGSSAMRAAGDEAERLGVITEEEARQAERFNDNMTRLTRVISHMGHKLANELMPFMDGLIVQLKELSLEARPGIVAALRDGIMDFARAVAWAWQGLRALAEAMPAWLQAAADAVPVLMPLVGWFKSLAQELGGARIVFAALAAALSLKLLVAVAGLFGPLTKLGWALGTVAVKSAWLLIGAVKALGVAILTTPVGWFLAAVAAIAGIAYVVYKNWDGIKAYFQNLWQGVKAAFDRGFIDGVVQAIKSFHPAALLADAVNGLVRYLFDVDLGAIGRRWIDSLKVGMADAWRGIVDWLLDKLSALPEPILKFMGLETDSLRNLAGVPSGASAAVPSALPGQAGANVSGKIEVEFQNAPAGMRVKKMRSETPGLDLGADVGMAMAGTG